MGMNLHLYLLRIFNLIIFLDINRTCVNSTCHSFIAFCIIRKIHRNNRCPLAYSYDNSKLQTYSQKKSDQEGIKLPNMGQILIGPEDLHYESDRSQMEDFIRSVALRCSKYNSSVLTPYFHSLFTLYLKPNTDFMLASQNVQCLRVS